MKSRFTILVLISFTSLSLNSCKEDTTPPSPETPPATKAGDPVKDSDFVGLTVEAGEALAKERGLANRVVSVDGEVRPVTMDYREDRINFTIEKGKIVKATRG